jgi:hypothetical protein
VQPANLFTVVNVASSGGANQFIIISVRIKLWLPSSRTGKPTRESAVDNSSNNGGQSPSVEKWTQIPGGYSKLLASYSRML